MFSAKISELPTIYFRILCPQCGADIVSPLKIGSASSNNLLSTAPGLARFTVSMCCDVVYARCTVKVKVYALCEYFRMYYSKVYNTAACSTYVVSPTPAHLFRVGVPATSRLRLNYFIRSAFRVYLLQYFISLHLSSDLQMIVFLDSSTSCYLLLRVVPVR